MNVAELLAVLRSEIQRIENAIRALERLDRLSAAAGPGSVKEIRTVTEFVDASKSDGLAVYRRDD
jgi:hypothetical protein